MSLEVYTLTNIPVFADTTFSPFQVISDGLYTIKLYIAVHFICTCSQQARTLVGVYRHKYAQFFVIVFVLLAFDFCRFCVIIRFFHPSYAQYNTS